MCVWKQSLGKPQKALQGRYQCDTGHREARWVGDELVAQEAEWLRVETAPGWNFDPWPIYSAPWSGSTLETPN
jgi:hypothetical protein